MNHHYNNSSIDQITLTTQNQMTAHLSYLPILLCTCIFISIMEHLNTTPLLLLRSHNKSFKARQKQLDKRVRNKKQLREQIYSNHDIFHSNINLYRNMTAQNIIWDKNYTFKCLINQAKDENSSLKARIWNLEKENRRMERQIEAWNLADYVQTNQKKPYIDMATVETVLGDQDYHIVSMRMQIFELEGQLQEKENEHSSILQQNKDSDKIIRLLNHQIAQRKVQMYDFLKGDGNPQSQNQSKEQLSYKLMKQNQQLQSIAKNLEIKKKSKQVIQNQLNVLSAQSQYDSVVSRSQIERLEEQTRQMKAEEDGGVNFERQKLRLCQKATLQFQCFMQQQMDKLIERKMPLQVQIEELKTRLEEWGSGNRKE